MKQTSLSSQEELFDNQKKRYFTNLSIQMRDAFKLHRNAGLWERVNGKRDWGNVSEHCLVETARVEILAAWLRLDEQMKSHLKTAAALHDFFKKREKEIAASEEYSWHGFEKAEAESERLLKEAGFDKSIVRIAGSVGHSSLLDMQKIMAQARPSGEDIACMIMHYVDDYTSGSVWVKPAEMSNGENINDLDKRIASAEQNQRYTKINLYGKENNLFEKGETTYQAQRRIGHLVESKLAKLMSATTGKTIAPLDLPELIDNAIREKITSN
ncbi:MAG: HD domain-containing protein [Parcubacteria group bacterium]|nr:HD domain-containing protein [Parcubacteria group bacterium]